MMDAQRQNTIRALSELFQANQYDRVIQACKKLNAGKPMDPVVSQLHGLSLRRMGQQKEARKVFEKGLKAFPLFPPLLNSYGNFLLDIGEVTAAVTAFKKAIAAQPGNLDFHTNLARAYGRQKAFALALQEYAFVLNGKPTDANASIGYAEAALELNRKEEAFGILTQALAEQPQHITLLNNLGNLCRRLGQLDDAIKHLSNAHQLQPENPVILRNLAACLVLNGDTEQAKQYFVQGIRISPFDIQCHEELANLLWSQGLDTPFQFIEQNLGKASERPEFWMFFIRLLQRADQIEYAFELSTQLYAACPNNAEVLTLHASLCRENNDLAQAIQLSRKAVKLNSNREDPSHENELGYSLLVAGESKEALSIYQRLCKKQPDNQGWWTMYSTALRQEGMAEKYRWLCNYDELVYAGPVAHIQDQQQFDDFIANLKRVLIELHQSTQHPIGQSLRNGTQTNEDLFDSSNEIIVQLKEHILSRAKEFIGAKESQRQHPFFSRLSQELEFQGSWSVCLRESGYHKSHFHPLGWLSGVMYVDLPNALQDEGQGWLVFGRPEMSGNQYPGDFAIKPQVGNVVFFPSFMWHGTNPFFSNEQRITVAFDLIPARASSR